MFACSVGGAVVFGGAFGLGLGYGVILTAGVLRVPFYVVEWIWPAA